MMIDFLKKQATFIKIEFWAFTTLFVFMLFFFITDGIDGGRSAGETSYYRYFKEANAPFSFYHNFFIPQLVVNLWLFFSFLLLNFVIIPKLVKRQAVLKNLLFIVIIFVLSALIFGVTNTYFKGYMYAGANRDNVHETLFVDGFQQAVMVLAVLVTYTTIKYAGLYLLSKIGAIHRRFSFVTREAIVATIIWLVVLLLLIIGQAEPGFVPAWMILIGQGIFFYSYAFHKMIPKVLPKKYPLLSYLPRSLLLIALLFFPVLGFFLVAMDNEERALELSALNTVFQLFITIPLTWLVYKWRQSGNEEVIVLKKELKRSSANIDFLRSQINPHFLFNALNTLYGTAIQENAERTSEAIQKLGDMMRFMLQENMQEKISLNREIDYLENYIALQRLRTDSNPTVQIQTSIDSNETMFQIAPMLLIPFVENAFKHGISFREPSHIKVTLEIKGKTLYFDVYNSKHIRSHSDPEKDKSGIGLENVKQRLKLLYPNRHELIVRDTTMEFFIHLTIQLA